MITMRVAAVMVVGVLLARCSAVAWGDRPGFYKGELPLGGPAKGSGPAPGAPGPACTGHGGRHHFRNQNLFFGVGTPFFVTPMWGGPVFSPYGNFGWWGPTGIYFNPATNTAEYYLPPTYAPAELSYGPLAMERFLGIRRDLPLALPPAEVAAEAVRDEPAPRSVVHRLRKSNDAARARAERFLEFGDALFLQQRCHEALQRYKSASEAAPDLPDAYARQGFALIAVNRHRLAAKALRIAIELDPDIIRSGLRLDDLYGDHRLAKASHLELLANDALASPDDGDLLFLVGLMLYADGEVERARRFLAKAADLGGPEAARLLAPLLHDAAPPGEAVIPLDT